MCISNDLISIIVPVYNVEKFLDDCIKSIIGQTYSNIEIILVDDGSTDACPEICERYAKLDHRIVVIHKSNGGLSSARNAGLNIASGKYISFVDSDDIISKFFIEKLYLAIINQNADVAQCKFINFYDYPQDTHERDDNHCFTYSSYDMQKKICVDKSVESIVVWNKLYKRSVYNELRFPVGKINEDVYTTYKAFDNSNLIVLLDNHLYFYRKNPNSIMGSKFNLKRLDIIGAYEEKLLYYENKEYMELYKLTLISYYRILGRLYVNTKCYITNNKTILEMIENKSMKIRSLIRYNQVALSKYDLCFLWFEFHFPSICALVFKYKEKCVNK